MLFMTLVGVVFVMIYAFTSTGPSRQRYFLTVPLLGALSSVLSKRIKVIQKRDRCGDDGTRGSTTESLRNIELVKSLGLAEQEVLRLNATTEKILKLELKKVKYLRSLSFIQGTFVNFLRTSILFLHALPDLCPEDHGGPVLLAADLFVLHLRPAPGAGERHQRRIAKPRCHSRTSARSCRCRQEPKPANPVPIDDLETLAFSDVSFTHQTASTPALNDISFSAKRGDTIAFVGPSGAGKTTLVKLLVGLYPPTEGAILYNGMPS